MEPGARCATGPWDVSVSLWYIESEWSWTAGTCTLRAASAILSQRLGVCLKMALYWEGSLPDLGLIIVELPASVWRMQEIANKPEYGGVYLHDVRYDIPLQGLFS